MDSNTLLRIYQTYSLEKISALSKQSLAMQYAQNGQLVQLNRQLAETNAATNSILKNQIKELERQENVRFYKNLIFKMNLALDKIEKQPITNFKLFLSSLFLRPIQDYSKESIDILEEIKDKEYAQSLIERTKEIANANKVYEVEYNQSAWISYLPTKEAYEDNKNKLAIRKKEFEIKKIEKKMPKKKVSNGNTKKILSTGCLIISILFFLVLAIADISLVISKEFGFIEFLVVIIIGAIPVAVSYMLRKRSETKKEKEMTAATEEGTEMNEYEQKIMQIKTDIDNLKAEDKGKEDYFTSISKAVKAECSNWEEQLNEIIELLPHEAEPETKIDPLFEKAAKMVVFWQKASAGFIQREYSIGYNRACSIIDQMEQLGIIAKDGNGEYDILCENETELTTILKDIKNPK